MTILNTLLGTRHESITGSDKDNNRSSRTIPEVATTSEIKSYFRQIMRSAIDEGGRRRHEAISSAYNVRAQVPSRRYRHKVVTLPKVMTLVGGQTRSGT